MYATLDVVSCQTPPPSAEPNPPLKVAGSGQETIRDVSLYNARPLLCDLHQVIQLMSIAGYETYVCMCFFVYKTLCAAIHMAAVGHP